MISELRAEYNQAFTAPKYEALLEYLTAVNQVRPNFRVSETPIFINKQLKNALLEACEEVGKFIYTADFKELSKGALDQIPFVVPNEDEHTTFLQMDFGICKDENGDFLPQLIETQGFPSLYFFQYVLGDAYRNCFEIPENFTTNFEDLSASDYLNLMKEVVVGETAPESVVMLEIEPEKQNTYIDFNYTAHFLGIKVLCLSKVLKEGKQLFYLNEAGEKIRIHKIYNRVIFDELVQRDDLERQYNFEDEVEVEWIGHPNWFHRISKYILPIIKTKYNPESFYLSELKEYPADLENFVLKPIFSFAGAGVRLNITAADLDEIAIEDKANYILQKKVKYESIIPTMDIPAKCEVRMLFIWPKNAKRPTLMTNLVRLSKGDMISVSHNKDKEWVGGSVGFFEK